MKNLIGLFLMTIILGCFFRSQPIQSDTYNKLISTVAQDSIQAPNPMNYSVFIDSISRSKEMRILQDAGLPCRVEFEILVNEDGNYLKHKWVGNPCHPLAENMIARYMPQLKFEPGLIKGIKQEMWVKMNVNWSTW